MKKYEYTNFIRWGNLNLVKQEGYSVNPDDWTFHGPPVRYGFYAFPEKLIEIFLLGKSYYVPYMHDIIKRDLIKEDIFKNSNYDIDAGVTRVWKNKKEYNAWLEYSKTTPVAFNDELEFQIKHSYLIKRKRPKKFRYDGEIWHHFDNKLKPNQVLKRHGTWVLTSMEIYIKQLKRELGVKYALSVSTMYSYSKDIAEVFIPQKI